MNSVDRKRKTDKANRTNFKRKTSRIGRKGKNLIRVVIGDIQKLSKKLSKNPIVTS